MGIKVYDVSNLERINCRTGSEGYQAKYYADNKEHFIKTQASLSGILMRDWQVEVIASKLCKLLNIYSVEQHHCKVKNNDRVLDAVVSNNFEKEHKEFISFETLINKFDGSSTHESAFIKMSSYDKLNYCACMISKATKINIKHTFKYMLDLAIIDILVGNIDRHTRNFGVFWDSLYSRYSIARVFDNGMGLFENDYYRDNYNCIEDRMRNTYVAPYGEDPFDMLIILKKHININNIYKFQDIKLSDYKFPNEDAKIYFKEVLKQIRSEKI